MIEKEIFRYIFMVSCLWEYQNVWDKIVRLGTEDISLTDKIIEFLP